MDAAKMHFGCETKLLSPAKSWNGKWTVTLLSPTLVLPLFKTTLQQCLLSLGRDDAVSVPASLLHNYHLSFFIGKRAVVVPSHVITCSRCGCHFKVCTAGVPFWGPRTCQGPLWEYPQQLSQADRHLVHLHGHHDQTGQPAGSAVSCATAGWEGAVQWLEQSLERAEVPCSVRLSRASQSRAKSLPCCFWRVRPNSSVSCNIKMEKLLFFSFLFESWLKEVQLLTLWIQPHPLNECRVKYRGWILA